MRKFKWTDAHAVHIPDIDSEHQALFQLCADLQCAITRDAPASQVAEIFQELAGHIVGHFSHEEGQMRAARYSLYQWHRRQHQAARSRVTLLGRRIRRGERDAALELLEFLSGWLHDHIRLPDRMLAAYLRNRQRALIALAARAS